MLISVMRHGLTVACRQRLLAAMAERGYTVERLR